MSPRMPRGEPRSVPDPAGAEYDAMMKRWQADQRASEAADAAQAALPATMASGAAGWPMGDYLSTRARPDSLGDELQDFQNGPRIGHPGTLESLIPVWGSGREALANLQEKDYPWAAFNGAMTLADGGVGSSAMEGLLKGAIKTRGPYVWRTKPWLNDVEKGVMDASTWMRQPRAFGMSHLKPGQPAHHWAIPQNGWGKLVPDWIKNQPWNIKPMPNEVVHGRIHGPWPGLPQFDWLERLHYGVPTWPKLLTGSSAGRVIDRIFDPPPQQRPKRPASIGRPMLPRSTQTAQSRPCLL